MSGERTTVFVEMCFHGQAPREKIKMGMTLYERRTCRAGENWRRAFRFARVSVMRLLGLTLGQQSEKLYSKAKSDRPAPAGNKHQKRGLGDFVRIARHHLA